MMACLEGTESTFYTLEILVLQTRIYDLPGSIRPKLQTWLTFA